MISGEVPGHLAILCGLRAAAFHLPPAAMTGAYIFLEAKGGLPRSGIALWVSMVERLPSGAARLEKLEPASGVRMAETKEVPGSSTRDETALDQPWNVVVHNDPVNLMVYVTMVFRKVFGFSREKAESHMLEVHHKGRSIVWSGARERAELYVQQLHSHLLLATIERDGM